MVTIRDQDETRGALFFPLQSLPPTVDDGQIEINESQTISSNPSVRTSGSYYLDVATGYHIQKPGHGTVLPLRATSRKAHRRSLARLHRDRAKG